MKAIVHKRYGRPDVLELEEGERPAITDDQVLVRGRASSVNPSEWYAVTGPYFARPSSGWRKPKRRRIGGDLAGVVETVGKDVKHLRPGDEVFGTSIASWAEYAPPREVRLARKPPNVSFEEAAAVPIAGITALQALRDHGQVQPGQKVLINGASGGVGTYAVQLAKALGADVTAVCSTRNVERAASLGADRVVDYTREDFTRLPERHALLLDIAGRTSFSRMRRVLTGDATIVLVGGKMTYRGSGPIPHLIRTAIASKGRSQAVKFFVAKINDDDLAFLGGLLQSGTIRSIVERTYELSKTAEALAYFSEGHAQGKIVLTV